MWQIRRGLQELFSEEALIPFDSRHPSLNRCQNSVRQWEAGFNYYKIKSVFHSWKDFFSTTFFFLLANSLTIWYADSTQTHRHIRMISWRHRERIGLMETGLLAHTPNVSGTQVSNYECHCGKHVGLKWRLGVCFLERRQHLKERNIKTWTWNAEKWGLVNLFHRHLWDGKKLKSI